MKRTVRRTTVIALLLNSCSPTIAETIMDQLGILRTDFDFANGNAIGGENLWGRRSAVQISDDFRTTDTGHVVTEVAVGNLTYFGVLPQDARISIFEKVDDRPAEEALYSARASELGPNQALNSARLPRWCHRCGSAQMERGGRAVA